MVQALIRNACLTFKTYFSGILSRIHHDSRRLEFDVIGRIQRQLEKTKYSYNWLVPKDNGIKRGTERGGQKKRKQGDMRERERERDGGEKEEREREDRVREKETIKKIAKELEKTD